MIRKWGRVSGLSRRTGRVPLPSFLDNMGGALNAGLEASTEVEVATCLSSMVAQHAQQTLGQKSPVDFTDAMGA